MSTNMTMAEGEADPSPPLEIRLFGRFEMLLHGLPAARLRSKAGRGLIALLVLRRHVAVDRRWLSETLWPDSGEEQALYNLRRNLSDLRNALDSEAGRLLTPTPRTLRLQLEGTVCDVVSFDAAMSRGNDSGLEEAVRLYRGSLLEDFDEDWVLSERQLREDACLTALEQLASRASPSEAVTYLRRAVRTDPYRETLYRQLMAAQARLGDVASVARSYRELRSLLRRDLEIAPHPETTELYRQLASRNENNSRVPIPPDDSPDLRPPRLSGCHESLPVYRNAFIGRKTERRELLERLSAERMVTLVGPGGVGKTRLAAAIAGVAREPIAETATFFDLSTIRHPTGVHEVVARALGAREEPGGEWLDILHSVLKDRSMLMVFDNCEHLLSSCKNLCDALLRSCPRLRILATSRQPLGIDGETIWRVPSLDLPDEPFSGCVDNCLRYGSIRLFVERASRADSRFRLTQDNCREVARICRQLDGLPLAIELAASRVRNLPLRDIAERLSSDLSVLTSDGRSTATHLHTLQASLDWSHHLLDVPERRLLCRISVFVDSVSLDAIEAVCAGPDPAVESLPERLAALVDRSLVDYTPVEGRYRLLETIRVDSMRRLRESGEEWNARRRLLEWCLAVVDGSASPKPAQTTTVDRERDESRHSILREVMRIDKDYSTIRAALDWGLSTERPASAEPVEEALIAAVCLRITAGLYQYWQARDLASEGRSLLRIALEHTRGGKPDFVRARALHAAFGLSLATGEYDFARSCLEEALEISRTVGAESDAAFFLGQMGVLHCQQGHFHQALPLLENALANRHEMQNRREEVRILDALATVHRHTGDYAMARAALERALALNRREEDHELDAVCRFNLGYVNYEEGRFDDARRCFEMALAIYREVGNRSGEARCLCGIGCFVNETGDPADARVILEQARSIHREMGNALGEAWVLSEIGIACYYRKNYDEAAILLEEALQIHREKGSHGNQAWNLLTLAAVTRARGEFRRSSRLHGEALRTMHSLGMARGSVLVLESFSLLLDTAGHSEEALRLLAAADTLRERIGAWVTPKDRPGHEAKLKAFRETLGDAAFRRQWDEGKSLTPEEAIDIVMEHPMCGK